MTQLIMHPLTERDTAAFIAHPSHAVLIHGPQGSGKGVVAEHLAASVLGFSAEQLADYPYQLTIDAPTISSSSKEAVSQLEHFLSLRVPKTGDVTRVVLITDAQALSLQAQNALLKTLEEPPQATLLILTADSQASILPTIVSRLQSIGVKRPSAEALVGYFKEAGHAVKLIEQAYAMSGGLPGLMQALLSDVDHPLQPATQVARELLQQTLYERLLTVDSLSKDKSLAVNTLFILQQMAHARLQNTTKAQFERWQSILQASYEASEQLINSAQPKLVLDSLMLKLK